MPYFLPFVLMLFSLPVSAATLTLNGKACGTISETRIDGAGNVAFTTDGQCGSVTPPPADPPVTPPASCPAGVVCVDKMLPIPQQSVSLGASQVMAVKMTVTSKGRFSTINTPASSPTRVVALSATPGDMNPANTRCKTSGGEVTSSMWQTTPADRKCVFPAGSTIYANIQMTNCTSRCAFLIAAQEGL